MVNILQVLKSTMILAPTGVASFEQITLMISMYIWLLDSDVVVSRAIDLLVCIFRNSFEVKSQPLPFFIPKAHSE
jgi:hypothetical protein